MPVPRVNIWRASRSLAEKWGQKDSNPGDQRFGSYSSVPIPLSSAPWRLERSGRENWFGADQSTGDPKGIGHFFAYNRQEAHVKARSREGWRGGCGLVRLRVFAPSREPWFGWRSTQVTEIQGMETRQWGQGETCNAKPANGVRAKRATQAFCRDAGRDMRPAGLADSS